MRALPTLASLIEAKPTVAIPEMLAFLASTSSNLISPRTLRLPPTYKSLPKVPTPAKVDRPVTLRFLKSGSPPIVAIPTPLSVATPTTFRFSSCVPPLTSSCVTGVVVLIPTLCWFVILCASCPSVMKRIVPSVPVSSRAIAVSPFWIALISMI